MLIDWFTVGAQVLNFLILVWLLKRFLYRPIRDAIDAREKQIAMSRADAAAAISAAGKERETLIAKSQAFDAQRSALLEKAAADAAGERERLFAQVRSEADALRAKERNAMRDDQFRLSRDIARTAQGEVMAIARQVLQDFAGVSLEERMAEVFMQRLRDIGPTLKEPLAAALKSSPEAIVRSSFELPLAVRTNLQTMLNETFGTSLSLRFEATAATLCGIELAAGGQRVRWNMADYLLALNQKVASLIAAEPAAGAPPVSRAKAPGAGAS